MDADRTAIRIFDLVDAGNLGQAEGALETALQKFPDHDGVRAAEAMVLLRTGQLRLAAEKAEALSTHNVTEAKAVNALVHVLQQCCCWDALATTYERIRHMQNERQINENLLQTYVRMGAYNKAHQLATQMYRQHSDPTYQVWMVQACLGQVPAGATDHLFLKLATKLLDAAVLTEKGKIAPTTVRTYVDILVQQGQYDEAVRFLCSKRGAKIGLLETRLEVLATVLKQQGKARHANAVAKQLWRMNADNWTPFSLYMDTLHPSESVEAAADAVLELESDDPELRTAVQCATADTSLDDGLVLARELQQVESEQRPKKPQRGPFMAELALLEKQGDRVALDAAVVAYAKRFYRKPCCYLDLSTFLSPHSAEAISQWSKAEDSDSASGDSASGEVEKHTKHILGLRCVVASWGATAEMQPPPEDMRALMATCRAAYEGAKPLSTSLAWSEEGLCDGYVNIGLNIALHAYVSSGHDLCWAVEGLELLRHVDRRLNNPSWLMFAVCFAKLLRASDVEALHQLAFRNVQMDTMTHIGYWPLFSGLALDDIQTWQEDSEVYFSHVERDCSLLRAKVFTFISWPAMQDVQEFERRQRLSCARWLAGVYNCAAALLDCQTQKNIFELFQREGPDLFSAEKELRTLQATDGAGLLDNTDWTVVKSMVLGNIHSEKVRTLSEALVAMPSMDERLRVGRQLLHSLLLLHDVAALEHHRVAAANAPKPKKSKKASNAAAAAATASETAAAGPVLYCPQLRQVGVELDFLPVVQAIAPSAVPYIESKGEDVVTYTEALRDALNSLVEQASSSTEFEQFWYPQAFILAALVRVGVCNKLPVQKWAADLHTAFQRALERYQEAQWECVSAPLDTLAASLQSDRVSRMKRFLSDRIVDVAASTRRK